MPNHLIRLVNTLSDEDNLFFIHIDSKSDIKNFDLIKNLKNVSIIPERFDCIWGDYSIIEATISLLDHFNKHENPGTHAILLSGQDYPLLPNKSINDFFAKNINKSFIECISLKNINWSDVDKRKRFEYYRINASSNKNDTYFIPSLNSERIYDDFNIKNFFSFLSSDKIDSFSKINFIKLLSKDRIIPRVDIYEGRQWFALNSYLVSKVLDFLKFDTEFIDYCKHSHAPDEFFFQTIVKHLQISDKNIFLSNSITYNNWSKQNVPLPVTFDMSDIDVLRDNSKHYIFARKFNDDTSCSLLDLLDELRISS